MQTGADWAACMPGTCQVGRLVWRPGGLPRQMFKWVKRLTPLTGEEYGGTEKRCKVTKSTGNETIE